jgi:hypothetical protein
MPVRMRIVAGLAGRGAATLEIRSPAQMRELGDLSSSAVRTVEQVRGSYRWIGRAASVRSAGWLEHRHEEP